MRSLLAAAVVTNLFAQAQPSKPTEWPINGGVDNIRYTTLRQITPENVNRLAVAWQYDSHDEFPGSEMQANPIVIGGVMYITTPKLRVVALDATTGRQIWSFDPNLGKPVPGNFRNRGVTVHGDRVFFTHRNFLWALHRKTGLPIQPFGDDGRVDLRKDLGRPVDSVTISATSPGVVFGDLLILGSTVSESLPGSPGHIRAYDTNTGKLRWTFHTIPQPGEFGYETWPKDAYKVIGGANAWGGVTIDSRNGILFAATGSAAFDFYGSNRIGDNLFANCVLALDARTGKRLWHFQAVRHDVWDMDFPAAPNLITLERDGKPIEAVAQLTKQGFVYVFERKTGKSLFPIEYRKVPQSPVDGEQLAETQPYPVKPPPFARQLLTEDLLTNRTPAARTAVLERFRKLNSKGMYYPPTTEGTIVFPGFDGGGEWGGAAFDPETGLYYVNSNEMAWILRLVPRTDDSLYKSHCASCHREDLKGTPPEFPSLAGIGKRIRSSAIAKVIREGSGRMPGFGSLGNDAIAQIVDFLTTGHDSAAGARDVNWQKYRIDGYNMFKDPDGYPAIAPPWGTLNAIDLNKGEIRWKIPLGEYPERKNPEKLDSSQTAQAPDRERSERMNTSAETLNSSQAKNRERGERMTTTPPVGTQGIGDTGTNNYGGPVVTASGLLFIAATNFDKKIRAFDKQTGTLLWQTTLPAAGNATPAVYEVDGREYIAIACGGGKQGAPSGGSIVAFALPK